MGSSQSNMKSYGIRMAIYDPIRIYSSAHSRKLFPSRFPGTASGIHIHWHGPIPGSRSLGDDIHVDFDRPGPSPSPSRAAAALVAASRLEVGTGKQPGQLEVGHMPVPTHTHNAYTRFIVSP